MASFEIKSSYPTKLHAGITFWAVAHQLLSPIMMETMEMVPAYAPELLEDPTPDLERHRLLADILGALEVLATLDMRSFVNTTAKPVTVSAARAMVASYQMLVEVIEGGMFAEELGRSAPDLLPRYVLTYDRALVRAKQIHAVLIAAVENVAGEQRRERPEERLARAIANANTVEPISLGDFTQHVDDEE